MLIKGNATFIPRAKVPAPNDGVHVNGSDGLLKGSHSVMLGDKLVPKGRVGLYWQKNDDVGVKVFYSFAWAKAQKMAYVKRIFKKWKRLYDLGIAPEPMKIVSVRVDVTYRGQRHKALAYGIKTMHVDAPKEAWLNYARGISYDWSADDHPEHSPAGYIRFTGHARRVMKKHNLEMEGSGKLGDIVWSCRKKRWYWCDID
jgi:hypothetical protein